MTKKKLAHLLDVTQCVGCSACIVACAQTNYPDMLERENTAWHTLPSNIRKITLNQAARPVQLLVQCQQCEEAPCVTSCPFGVNVYDPETSQVVTDPSRCVGCSFCIASCPYDARWMHPDTGLPVKCMGSGCQALIKEGQDPACVQACAMGARLFGDVLDPASAISQKIRRSRTQKLLSEKGTKPNFYVVVQQ